MIEQSFFTGDPYEGSNHCSDDNPYPWDSSHVTALNCICIIIYIRDAPTDRPIPSWRDDGCCAIGDRDNSLRMKTRSAAINRQLVIANERLLLLLSVCRFGTGRCTVADARLSPRSRLNVHKLQRARHDSAFGSLCFCSFLCNLKERIEKELFRFDAILIWYLL